MTDQQLFELGQLYSDLLLIRGLVNAGSGVRQRLLSQSQCERIQGIATAANDLIGDVMRLIDDHKVKSAK
mgnify:CR=1 FL=1